MDRASSAAGRTNLFRSIHMGLWLFILAAEVALLAASAHAQATQWEQQMDGWVISSVAANATGIYVVGNQSNPGEQASAAIAKFNSQGSSLWVRNLVPGNASAVAVKNNFVYVAGTLVPSSITVAGRRAFLSKFDITGAQIWTRSFASDDGTMGLQVVADGSGVYVGGFTYGPLASLAGDTINRSFVRKYDLDGNESWTRQFGASDEFVRPILLGLAADPSGLHLAGLFVPFNDIRSKILLQKFDFDGNEIWTRPDSDFRQISLAGLAISDSAIYLGGARSAVNGGEGIGDAFLNRYDEAGNMTWSSQQVTGESNETYSISADQTGVYAAGFVSEPIDSPTYYAVATIKKYDPSGNVLWSREFDNRSPGSVDYASGIAVYGDELFVGVNSAEYSSSGQLISTTSILKKLDSGAPPINDGPPPQIAAAGIRNSASLVVNSSVAQGSIFTVFGDNLGPATPVQANGFPLPTSGGLAGTSIRVTVNGTSLDAPILYTSAKQVAAILPSATPLGSGTLTVTHNGLAASPAAMTVVERSFAIYTVNQNGQGPGVVQNVYSPTDIRTNTPFETARPGQVAVLWGTGLGAVGGNEAGGVLPGDQTSLDMHLWVGGRDATVFYRGRSGCCAGVDQINFVVPDGIEGCYVPITVQIGDSISPYSSMSIRSGGGTCSLPYGLTSAELDAARARGSIRLGNIFFDTLAISYSGGPEIDQAASAYFYNYPVNEFGTPDQFTVPIQAGVEGSIDDLYGLSRNIAVGSCTVSSTSQTNLPLDRALDAGLVTASGRVLSKYPPGAYYNLILPQTFNVSVDNAGGGTGASAVGPFQVSTLGAGAFSTIMVTGSDRAKGIQIKWTGGDPHGFVYVVGWTDGISSGAGTIFSCLAPGSAGTFFVPPSVTLALPESKTHTVGFELLNMPSPVRFDAAGLDAGFLTIENQSIREVDLN